MAKFTFERLPHLRGPDDRPLRFDSSPHYSIPKQFGYNPSTFRYEKIPSKDSKFEVFNIYAKMLAPEDEAALLAKGADLQQLGNHVGVLKSETLESILNRTR